MNKKLQVDNINKLDRKDRSNFNIIFFFSYVKSGGGFTEALVRAAGHLVPIDKPAQAYQLVSYFIRHLDMPLPANYKPSPENTPELPDFRLPGDIDHQDHSVIPHQPPIAISKTTEEEPTGDISTKSGMIVSIVINVVLVAVVGVGVVLYCRLKRKTEDFFYSNVDNASDDIFLT